MMGLFNNLFSKKGASSSNALEVVASTKSGYIGEAERIANVVAAGLEKENYSGMNEQLSVIAQKDEEKDVYVFEHPGVISRYYAIALIVGVSLAFAYYLFIGAGTAYFSTTDRKSVV